MCCVLHKTKMTEKKKKVLQRKTQTGETDNSNYIGPTVQRTKRKGRQSMIGRQERKWSVLTAFACHPPSFPFPFSPWDLNEDRIDLFPRFCNFASEWIKRGTQLTWISTIISTPALTLPAKYSLKTEGKQLIQFDTWESLTCYPVVW